jgi:hypothetical protein
MADGRICKIKGTQLNCVTGRTVHREEDVNDKERGKEEVMKNRTERKRASNDLVVPYSRACTRSIKSNEDSTMF